MAACVQPCQAENLGPYELLTLQVSANVYLVSLRGAGNIYIFYCLSGDNCQQITPAKTSAVFHTPARSHTLPTFQIGVKNLLRTNRSVCHISRVQPNDTAPSRPHCHRLQRRLRHFRGSKGVALLFPQSQPFVFSASTSVPVGLILNSSPNRETH